MELILAFKAEGSFGIGYNFNIDGVGRIAYGEIGPEIINTFSGSAAIDVKIAQGGISFDIIILYNTLKVFAELKLDKWPIDVRGGLKRTQLPLHVSIDAWYALRTKVLFCGCSNLDEMAKTETTLKKDKKFVAANAMKLVARLLEFACKWEKSIQMPCGLTWNTRHSTNLIGFSIPPNSNGQPVEDMLLELASIEPNEAPVVPEASGSTRQLFNMVEDESYRQILGGFDPQDDVMVFEMVASDGPYHIEILNPNTGLIKLTPKVQHYSGNGHMFAYQISDGSLMSEVSVVEVVLNAVADVPTLFTEIMRTDEDQPFEIHWIATLVDQDGSEELTLRISGLPGGGKLLKNGIPQRLRHFGVSEDSIMEGLSGDVGSYYDVNVTELLSARIMPTRQTQCLTPCPQEIVRFEPVCLTSDGTTTVYSPCDAVTCLNDGYTPGYCNASSVGTVWSIQPAPDFYGNIKIDLTAYATEKSNGNQASITKTASIQVVPINDQPVLMAMRNQDIQLAEDENFAMIGMNIWDVDAWPNAGGGDVTVRIETQHGQPEVARGMDVPGVVIEEYSEGRILELTGGIRRVNVAIQQFMYRGIPNYNGNETLKVTVLDNGNYGMGEFKEAVAGVAVRSDFDTQKGWMIEDWATRKTHFLQHSGLLLINIFAINDAPIMTIPPPILATENVTCDIMNMSIMDPDDEGGDMTLQLTSKMSPDGTAFGLIWFDNSWAPAHTITAPKHHINQLLLDVKYEPKNSNVCAHSVTSFVRDNGNSGQGGEKSSTRTVGISLLMMNNPPTITSTFYNPTATSIEAVENVPFVFANTINGVHLEIEDTDAGNGELKTTISVSHGSFNLPSNIPGIAIDGFLPGRTCTIYGALLPLNNLLSSVNFTYTPDAYFTGNDNFVIVTNDQGNFGFSDIVLGIPDVSLVIQINLNAVALPPLLDVGVIVENQNRNQFSSVIPIASSSDDLDEMVTVVLTLVLNGQDNNDPCNVGFVAFERSPGAALTSTVSFVIDQGGRESVGLAALNQVALHLPAVPTKSDRCLIDLVVTATSTDGTVSSTSTVVTKRVHVGGVDDGSCTLNGGNRRRLETTTGRKNRLKGRILNPSCTAPTTCNWKALDTCNLLGFHKELTPTTSPSDCGTLTLDSKCCKNMLKIVQVHSYCNEATYATSVTEDEMLCGSSGGESVVVEYTKETSGAWLSAYPAGSIRCKWAKGYDCATVDSDATFVVTEGSIDPLWTDGNGLVRCTTPDWGQMVSGKYNPLQFVGAVVGLSYNKGLTFHSGGDGFTKPSENNGEKTVVSFVNSNQPPTILFGDDKVTATNRGAMYTLYTEEDTDTYITGIHVMDQVPRTAASLVFLMGLSGTPTVGGAVTQSTGATGTVVSYTTATKTLVVTVTGGTFTVSSTMIAGVGTISANYFGSPSFTINQGGPFSTLRLEIRTYTMSPQRVPLENVLFLGSGTEATVLSGQCLCDFDDYANAQTRKTHDWHADDIDDINYQLSLLKFRAPPDFNGEIFIELTATDLGNVGHLVNNRPGTHVRTMKIVVTPVNDSPSFVMNVPPTLKGIEGTLLPVPGVTLRDPDMEGSTLSKANVLDATARLYLDGKSLSTAAPSCRSIKAHFPNSSPSDTYFLSVLPGGAAAEVFCDMDTDGGGWALLGYVSHLDMVSPTTFFNGISSVGGGGGDGGGDEGELGAVSWSHPIINLVRAASGGKTYRSFDLATTITTSIRVQGQLVSQGSVQQKTARAKSTRMTTATKYTWGVLRIPSPTVLHMSDAALAHHAPLSIQHKCDVESEEWDRTLPYITRMSTSSYSQQHLGLSTTKTGGATSQPVWFWSSGLNSDGMVYVDSSSSQFSTTYCGGEAVSFQPPLLLPKKNEKSTAFWYRETDLEEQVTNDPMYHDPSGIQNDPMFQDDQIFQGGVTLPIVEQGDNDNHIKFEAENFVSNAFPGTDGMSWMAEQNSMGGSQDGTRKPWAVVDKERTGEVCTSGVPASVPTTLPCRLPSNSNAASGKAVVSLTACGQLYDVYGTTITTNYWCEQAKMINTGVGYGQTRKQHRPALLKYLLRMKKTGQYRLWLRRSLFITAIRQGVSDWKKEALDEQRVILPLSGGSIDSKISWTNGDFRSQTWVSAIGTSQTSHTDGQFEWEKTDRVYTVEKEHLDQGHVEFTIGSSGKGFSLDQIMLVLEPSSDETSPNEAILPTTKVDCHMHPSNTPRCGCPSTKEAYGDGSACGIRNGPGTYDFTSTCALFRNPNLPRCPCSVGHIYTSTNALEGYCSHIELPTVSSDNDDTWAQNQRSSWVQGTESSSSSLASGSTVPGNTDWTSAVMHLYVSTYAPHITMYVEVDTSAHKFGTTPLYFAQLVAQGKLIDGVSEAQQQADLSSIIGTGIIYASSATSFRMYIGGIGPSGVGMGKAQLNERGWHVQWVAVPQGASTLFHGRSQIPSNSPSKTWSAPGASSSVVRSVGITIPIVASWETDPTSPKYSVPKYFVSVQHSGTPTIATDGNMILGRLVGMDTVVSSSPSSFTIRVQNPAGVDFFSPEDLRNDGWSIGWFGVSEEESYPGVAFGRKDIGGLSMTTSDTTSSLAVDKRFLTSTIDMGGEAALSVEAGGVGGGGGVHGHVHLTMGRTSGKLDAMVAEVGDDVNIYGKQLVADTCNWHASTGSRSTFLPSNTSASPFDTNGRFSYGLTCMRSAAGESAIQTPNIWGAQVVFPTGACSCSTTSSDADSGFTPANANVGSNEGMGLDYLVAPFCLKQSLSDIWGKDPSGIPGSAVNTPNVCSWNPIPGQKGVLGATASLKDCVDQCVGASPCLQSTCEILCTSRWDFSDGNVVGVSKKVDMPKYGDNAHGIRWITPCLSSEPEVKASISTGTEASVMLKKGGACTDFVQGITHGRRITFQGAYSRMRRCLSNFSYWSDEDFTCADELQITANDLNGGEVTEYVNVEMELVNDPPYLKYSTDQYVNSSSYSTQCSITYSQFNDTFIPDLIIPENSNTSIIPGFNVEDSDADVYPVEVFLEVNEECNATISFANGDTGLLYLQNSSTRTQFRAPLLVTNAALSSLTFVPSRYWYGTCTITAIVNDQGNYPGMIEWAQPKAFKIQVVPVNDPPVIVLGNTKSVGIIEVNEGNTIRLFEKYPLMNIFDVDRNDEPIAGADQLKVVFTVENNNGIVDLEPTGASTEWDSWLTQTNDGIILDVGKYKSDIHTMLPMLINLLVYRPNPSKIHFSGMATVAMTVWDLGNNGNTLDELACHEKLPRVQNESNIGLKDTIQLQVHVMPVPDKPVLYVINNVLQGYEDQPTTLGVSLLSYSMYENVTIFLRPIPTTSVLSHGRLILNKKEYNPCSMTKVNRQDTLGLKTCACPSSHPNRIYNTSTCGLYRSNNMDTQLCALYDDGYSAFLTLPRCPCPSGKQRTSNEDCKQKDPESVWLLTPEDLSSTELTMTTPENYHGAAMLNIHSRSEEPSTGESAEDRTTITMAIAPTNDVTKLFLSPGNIETHEDEWCTVMGLDVHDVDAEKDPTQFLQFQVTAMAGTKLTIVVSTETTITYPTTNGIGSGNGTTTAPSPSNNLRFLGSLKDVRSILRKGVLVLPPPNYNNVGGDGDGYIALPDGLLTLNIEVIDIGAYTKGMTPSGPISTLGAVNVTVHPVNDFPVLFVSGIKYQDLEGESDLFFEEQGSKEYNKFAVGPRRRQRRMVDASEAPTLQTGTTSLPFVCVEDLLCDLANLVNISDVDDATTTDEHRKPFRLRATSHYGTISINPFAGALDVEPARGGPGTHRISAGNQWVEPYQGTPGARENVLELVGTLQALNLMLSGLDYLSEENKFGMDTITMYVEDMCCINSSSTVATVKRAFHIHVQPSNDPPAVSMEIFGPGNSQKESSVDEYVVCEHNYRYNTTSCFNRTRLSNNGTNQNASLYETGGGSILVNIGGGRLSIEALISDDANDFSNGLAPVEVSLFCDEFFGHFDFDTSSLAVAGVQFTQGAPTGFSHVTLRGTIQNLNTAFEDVAFIPDFNEHYNATEDIYDEKLNITRSSEIDFMNITIKINDLGSGSLLTVNETMMSTSITEPFALTTSMSIEINVNRSLALVGGENGANANPSNGAIGDLILDASTYAVDSWEDYRISISSGVIVRSLSKTQNLTLTVTATHGALVVDIPDHLQNEMLGVISTSTDAATSLSNTVVAVGTGNKHQLFLMLKYLIFEPTVNYYGAVTTQFVLSDNSSGSATSSTVLSTVVKTINIQPVNDRPIFVNFPTSMGAFFDGPPVLLQFGVFDVDANLQQDQCQVSCSVTDGTFEIGALDSLGFDVSSDLHVLINHDATTVQFENVSIALMSNVLEAAGFLKYQPPAAPGTSGSGATISCTVNDLGHAGAGGPMTTDISLITQTIATPLRAKLFTIFPVYDEKNVVVAEDRREVSVMDDDTASLQLHLNAALDAGSLNVGEILVVLVKGFPSGTTISGSGHSAVRMWEEEFTNDANSNNAHSANNVNTLDFLIPSYSLDIFTVHLPTVWNGTFMLSVSAHSMIASRLSAYPEGSMVTKQDVSYSGSLPTTSESVTLLQIQALRHRRSIPGVSVPTPSPTNNNAITETYSTATSSICHLPITTAAECSAAATALNIAQTSTTQGIAPGIATGSFNAFGWPSGCLLLSATNTLHFNTETDSPHECSSQRQCLCKGPNGNNIDTTPSSGKNAAPSPAGGTAHTTHTAAPSPAGDTDTSTTTTTTTTTTPTAPPKDGNEWKKNCMDEKTELICSGYGQCSQQTQQCDCRRGFTGPTCSVETEVIEIKIDENYDEMKSSKEKEQGFRKRVRADLSKKLDVKEDIVDIIEVRKGSIVIVFQILEPKETTERRIDTIRKTEGENAPLMNNQIGSTTTVQVDRVRRDDATGQEVSPKNMEDHDAMEEGNTQEKDLTAILVGAIGGGLFIVGLVIVAVLYVRHNSSKKRTKKSRAASKNNSSMVEDTDGIELIENVPRWQNSIDNTLNKLNEQTVTGQDTGAIQWANGNPLYNNDAKKEEKEEKKKKNRKKKGRQMKVTTRNQGEMKAMDRELDVVFDSVVSNDDGVNSNPMYKNKTIVHNINTVIDTAIATQEKAVSEDWEVLNDEISGKEYYFNQRSGLTQWEKPNESTTAANEMEHSSENKRLPEDWEALNDETSGNEYYFNRSSGSSQWEFPKE